MTREEVEAIAYCRDCVTCTIWTGSAWSKVCRLSTAELMSHTNGEPECDCGKPFNSIFVPLSPLHIAKCKLLMAKTSIAKFNKDA